MFQVAVLPAAATNAFETPRRSWSPACPARIVHIDERRTWGPPGAEASRADASCPRRVQGELLLRSSPTPTTSPCTSTAAAVAAVSTVDQESMGIWVHFRRYQ